MNQVFGRKARSSHRWLEGWSLFLFIILFNDEIQFTSH